MQTYTITVSGYMWEHGLTKKEARNMSHLIEMNFPGSKIAIVKEL